MFSGTKKKPFQCPKCAFVQLEPPHLISTYCRACGDYYEVPRVSGASKPSVLPGLPLTKQSRRDVVCHRCGTTHSTSRKTRITMCPGCNASISLEDEEFLGPASRPVDTRGHLHVGPQGCLTSSWIICGTARIEGRVSGKLLGEGEVVLAARQLLVCHVTAPSVVIDKHARTSLPVPVCSDALIVRGHLAAPIRCRGRVHVMRGGRLTGEVHARSVAVERGGVLEGDCFVDPGQPEELAQEILELRQRRAFSPLMPGDPSLAT